MVSTLHVHHLHQRMNPPNAQDQRPAIRRVRCIAPLGALGLPVTFNKFSDSFAVQEVDGAYQPLGHLFDNLLPGILSESSADSNDERRDIPWLFRADLEVGHSKG